MPGSWGPRQVPQARATALAVGLYAVVLVAGPLLHHDLACHLKSRTHCSACVTSVTASGTQDAAGLIAVDLQASGALALDGSPSVARLSVSSLVGRSPPA
jgi:hypothetical protein